MKIIIILLLSIKEAYFFELNLTKRINKGLIANGLPYDAEKYPFVVTIIITIPGIDEHYYSEGICTGSLVKELYVLTAAHCIYKINQTYMKVFLGSKSNNNYRRVAKLYVKKQYKDFNEKKDKYQSDDIGVIKLEKSFPDVKKYIQIGGKPKDFENHKAVECTCIGFGKKNSEEIGFEGRMMTTNVRHGRTACRGYNNNVIKKHWKEFLCPAAGRLTMTCQGDSGGPVICNDKLYGVASFLYNYKGGNNTCGGHDIQCVHTFINYHLKWINCIIDPDANKKKKKE